MKTMKKKNEEGVSAQRMKQLIDPFRREIEKYLIEHECTNVESITLISMALYDIFESIAKIEEKSPEEVLGYFVKMFGVWDYLKTKKEG